MMTPGDVIGIPSRQVIRCAPVNGVVDAEPNFLASIEFDAPDLPWMFSRKPASGPTQPWITLAVVDVTDIETDPLSASPVGTQLTIGVAQLPIPAEAWMWAHGQLLDADTVPGDPARSLSRLVSSRSWSRTAATWRASCRLRRGQGRGLGTDPGDDARAWISRGIRRRRRHPAGLLLLAIRHWADGDFESPGAAAHAAALPPGPGRRKLLLDYPMSGLPAPDPDGASVDLQVALRPPGERLDAIQPLVGASYLDVLRSRLVDAGYDTSLLASNPDAPPPAVGPPVYGQLAVGATATAANLAAVAPPWVRETNLDPRLRVAAGLGGEVVRQNQDRYLEEAWRQVGDVLGANKLRRARSPGRQRGPPPEMDRAALGRRPRDVDGARSRAPVCRREPHNHRATPAVAAAAVNCFGRIPPGHARAWHAHWCGSVARGGRSGGPGVAVGCRAAVEGRGRAGHDRRAGSSQPCLGTCRHAVHSRAPRARSRPDWVDGGAGRDPA